MYWYLQVFLVRKRLLQHSHLQFVRVVVLDILGDRPSTPRVHALSLLCDSCSCVPTPPPPRRPRTRVKHDKWKGTDEQTRRHSTIRWWNGSNKGTGQGKMSKAMALLTCLTCTIAPRRCHTHTCDAAACHRSHRAFHYSQHVLYCCVFSLHNVDNHIVSARVTRSIVGRSHRPAIGIAGVAMGVPCALAIPGNTVMVFRSFFPCNQCLACKISTSYIMRIFEHLGINAAQVEPERDRHSGQWERRTNEVR